MILGKKVALRPVEESDVPLIHRWVSNPEIWRYMDYERPSSLADVADDLQRTRQDGVPFTILLEGRPIGRIGLNQFRRRDRIASFYMYIGEPDFWGRGYARDAIMALLSYAFERYDLWQVELWTLGDNDRAVRAYTACGFVEEARLRDRSWKDGGWIDHIVMSVNREEFDVVRREWEAGGR